MSSSRAATLHSGLLARKGLAVPAGGGYGAMAPASPAAPAALPPTAAPEPAPRPKPVSLVGGGDPTRLPDVAAAPRRPAASGRPPREGDHGRLRFTLRLDRQRYKQLRIMAAQTGRTSRDIVIEALESYLKAAGPACACLRDGSETCDSG